MKKKMIAGNWKMNGSRQSVSLLLNALKQGAETLPEVEIVVFPAFVHLPLTEQVLQHSSIAWGAQDLYISEAGAFTGEIAGSMLVDYGCRYVLIGHSERRSLFYEDLHLVAAKYQAAHQIGLKPLLCLGETEAERESGEAETILANQLGSVIKKVGIDVFRDAIIAYEPVWAIGTGLTATPELAQNRHAFIRNYLRQFHVEIANSVRILYGGSVKPDNAKGLFEMPDIDGALVGGASLDAKLFLEICRFCY